MSHPDFNPEEKEFRLDLEPALAEVRAIAGPCPAPDLLMAAVSGVEIEDAPAVRRHVARCPTCRQLSRDLAAYEYPGVSEMEDRRIRSRWSDAKDKSNTPPFWKWLVRPLPIGVAVAAVALVVALAVWKVRPAGSLAPPQQAAQATREPAGSLAAPSSSFVLEKAAIKIPAASVLLFRGTSDNGQAFLAEFAAALEPYRAGDYTEAARRLAVLRSKYSDSAEAAFYLGVSLLFTGQSGPALESLEAARSRADNTLRDDVSWYLAIAHDRVGREADALQAAEALCRHPGEYRDRACAAAERSKRK